MIPPRQRPYEQALQLGFDVLLARPPTSERLATLGATVLENTIRLPALNACLSVDLGRRDVFVEGLGRAQVSWAVLAVHYLSAGDLVPDAREVSFGHFQDCRSYLTVFGKRIVGRFLATSGKSGPIFSQRAETIAATKTSAPGLGYCFHILPRIPITIILHEGDDEIASGASVVYRADIEQLLPAEDRVVAAELLLDVLAGKPMAEV